MHPAGSEAEARAPAKDVLRPDGEPASNQDRVKELLTADKVAIGKLIAER